MSGRIKLHNELCKILGSKYVYYQPPESIKMQYPAIVYSTDNITNLFCGNAVYMQHITYQVIVIDSNPDSDIVRKLSRLPKCRHVRTYTKNNLNHNVFRITEEEIK